MTTDIWTRVDATVQEHLGKTFPAAQIEIVVRGRSAYHRAFGYLDPETRSRTLATSAGVADQASRFDLASVSKLFTVTAFMTLVEQGRVRLDQPVREILPEFCGTRTIAAYPDPLQTGKFVEVVPPTGALANADAITFRHLLVHNSGLPAWLPLWKMSSRSGMLDAALHTPFAYPTGTRVVYSDIGLILVAFALEKVTGQGLADVVRERVTAPLGLSSIAYGPIPGDDVAPTEFYAHQNRRMRGEVHDENAFALGGVAGHAGLFGTARDVAALGEMYRQGGTPLLKSETVGEMTRLQAQDGAVRRGIGFVLWSPDPEASGNPFSDQAFGHTGFTGTSLWVDPARDLTVACMTNRVYYGRDNAAQIMAFRVALHRAVCQAVDEG